jgi:hypothetical protein
MKMDDKGTAWEIDKRSLARNAGIHGKRGRRYRMVQEHDSENVRGT